MLNRKCDESTIWQICEYFASRSGPYRGRLEQLSRERRASELGDLSLDYAVFDDTWHVIAARQVEALFKKNTSFCDEASAQQSAWEKFVANEVRCAVTNAELGQRLLDLEPRDAAVIHGAIQKIARILGTVPRVSELELQFSGGASTTVKRGPSSALYKLRSPAVNPAMYCNLGMWLSTLPHLAIRHGRVIGELDDLICLDFDAAITSGRLEFVPKDRTTLRSIVVEPTLATMAQKGYGNKIRARLKKAGLDLSVGQEKHRELARRASLTGELATIDFSSASDLISRRVVEELLPDPWTSALSSCRTSTVLYHHPDGSTKRLTLLKWSSMGNGYTFELETLIFYALALAVCEVFGYRGEVSVYGDDVILPSQAFLPFTRVCETLGFVVNTKKSYASGPFRESCGGDYLKGVDIRPCYLKGDLDLHALYRMHNFYYRRCELDVCAFLLTLIPEEGRLFGPDGYGDGHLLGSYRLKQSGAQRRKGYEGGYFLTYRKSVPKAEGAPKHGPNYWSLHYGDYLYALYSAGSHPDERGPDPYSLVGDGPWEVARQYTMKRGILV